MGVPSSTPTHIIACEVVTSGQQRAKKDGPAYSIALVPLTSQMFPSAAAPAFRQLFEAYASNGGKMTMEAYYERVVGRVSARVEAGEHFAVPVAVCLAEGSSSEWRVVGQIGLHRKDGAAVLSMYHGTVKGFIANTTVRLACIMLVLDPGIIPTTVTVSLRRKRDRRVFERWIAFAAAAVAWQTNALVAAALHRLTQWSKGTHTRTICTVTTSVPDRDGVSAEWFIGTIASYAHAGVTLQDAPPPGLAGLFPTYDVRRGNKCHVVYQLRDHNLDGLINILGESSDAASTVELITEVRNHFMAAVFPDAPMLRGSPGSSVSGSDATCSEVMSPNQLVGGSSIPPYISQKEEALGVEHHELMLSQPHNTLSDSQRHAENTPYVSGCECDNCVLWRLLHNPGCFCASCQLVRDVEAQAGNSSFADPSGRSPSRTSQRSLMGDHEYGSGFQHQHHY